MAEKRKRKSVTMTVTASVPGWMTAAQARREIRSRINHGAGYLSHGPNFEEVEVRASAVTPYREQPCLPRIGRIG